MTNPNYFMKTILIRNKNVLPLSWFYQLITNKLVYIRKWIRPE